MRLSVAGLGADAVRAAAGQVWQRCECNADCAVPHEQGHHAVALPPAVPGPAHCTPLCGLSHPAGPASESAPTVSLLSMWTIVAMWCEYKAREEPVIAHSGAGWKSSPGFLTGLRPDGIISESSSRNTALGQTVLQFIPQVLETPLHVGHGSSSWVLLAAGYATGSFNNAYRLL